MARWRLNAAHYLNVPDTEWEYKETDRTSGRQGRKLFVVPRLLDPNDPNDQNYPGEVIVCDAPSRTDPKDYQFSGQPTPDMEPLDDAAQAITDSIKHKWVHPIESLPGQGDYSASLVKLFEAEMLKAKDANPVSAKGASADDVAELKRQVEALTQQLAAAPPPSIRRT